MEKLTKDRLIELLRDSNRKEICLLCQISERTLSRLLSKFGLVKKQYGPKGLDKPTMNKINQLYDTGNFTQEELGIQFGVSQPMICKIVNKESPSLTFGGFAEVKVGYKV